MNIIYPIEVFPEEIRDFIHNEAEVLQCPESFIGLPLVCQVAAVIGSRLRVSPWCGWVEPSILWGCVVADSGSNKSRAQEAGMAYLRDRQYRFNDIYREALESREKDADLPVLERCLISDCTYEALLLALTRNSSMIWLYDELGLWFERLKTGSTNNVTGVLSLYDGRAQSVTRKTGDNKEIIPLKNACVSVFGTCQLDVLRKLLRQIAAYQNGLAYRFLYAVEDPVEFDWYKLAVDENKYNYHVKEAYRVVQGVGTGIGLLSDVRTLKFSLESQALLRSYLQDLERQRGKLDAPTIGKARGQIVRLSLILECLHNCDFIDIKVSSLMGAIKLWEYHNASAQKLIESVSTAWVDQVADKILGQVERAEGRALSIRELRHGFSAGNRPSVTQTVDILRKLAVNRQIRLLEEVTSRGVVIKVTLPENLGEKSVANSAKME